ncbi:hypothetical protein HFO27_13430 [Rhizobium leguminosarum]|uniref:hypothetical protein n=1 Tax=Rhizobium leguminosarum TaxID=384 RepID=UPI001C91F599|nr:hypothetical protein [Rhizobium leguminosarum]MBY3175633.1 hypothetical protein [Rhizobium leguminosarum]
MEDQGRISIRNFAKITKNTFAGDTLLASFDVGIGGIDLHGCALIEAADGHQFVVTPGRPGRDGRRPVFIADVDLRARLLRLAQLKLADGAEDAGLRRVLCAAPTWGDDDAWSKPGATWTNTSGNAAENESLTSE